MDGNNRWSKKNKRSKYDSYKNGAKKLIEITKFIFDNYDINYVSAFALSKHNFKRGSSIINIIEEYVYGGASTPKLTIKIGSNMLSASGLPTGNLVKTSDIAGMQLHKIVPE